jgi:hypothetical protein
MDGWNELARASTATGDELVLRERAGCVELRCNGWELMSNRAHHSETALAALACAHQDQDAPPPLVGGGWGEGCGPPWPADARTPPPNPLPQGEGEISIPIPISLLIGGLGLGYTLRAALDRLPCSARVVVAELLPEIIAWNRGMLARLTGDPLADPRVSVICADVSTQLRTAEPASFDAILLDTDNGPDAIMIPGNASLYGPETLRMIRRALRPAGVLAVWSADPSPQFEHRLRLAGFPWRAHPVPARGGPNDPLHTIYLAWNGA